MSMIARDRGSNNIPILEDGVYTAISQMLIDLGVQKSEKFDKSQRKFMIIWQILNETIEINGEQLPRLMSREYSFSLGSKSNLRHALEAWRGKAFTEEELLGFNLVNVLNKGCQLQIITKENNGNKYNNIAGIMALPKGTELNNKIETMIFDIEDKDTWNMWEKIPNWIQEKIKKAENYQEKELDRFVEKKEKDKQGNNVATPDDDLPF